MSVPTITARAFGQSGTTAPRTFHFSTSCSALEIDPELFDSIASAGVTNLWLTGSWTGQWVDPPPLIAKWCAQIRARGLSAHVINVPLGHPGTGSAKWPPGMRPDGSAHTGTSLHAPAIDENCSAVRQLEAMRIDRVFLDDDFRLATGPGVIGAASARPTSRIFCSGLTLATPNGASCWTP